MLKNKFISVSKVAALFLGGALFITSCKKDNADPIVPPTVGKLAVGHFSPGSPEYILKLNGVKADVNALTYGTYLQYQNIQTGTYEFSIAKKDAPETITKITSAVAADKNYSLFITDVPTKATLVITEDDLAAPATDKAKVRLVNLSSDAGDADLAITGTTEAISTKTSFKGASAFVNVTPGAEVNFEIRENGKTTVLATLPKAKIEKGKIYTIVAKGLKSAADATKLTLQLITSK